MNSPTKRGVGFWVGVAIGWALIVVGLRGIVVDGDATQPSDLARWVLGLALLHDLVIAPVVFALGWAIGRIAPRAAGPLRVGLAASALTAALAWPLVRRYGARPVNPTLLPLDYERSLVIALVAIWLGVAAALVTSRRRSHATTEAAR